MTQDLNADILILDGWELISTVKLFCDFISIVEATSGMLLFVTSPSILLCMIQLSIVHGPRLLPSYTSTEKEDQV